MKKFFTILVVNTIIAFTSQAQNNALSFDGVNDYVQTSVSSGTTYTLEAWIKPNLLGSMSIIGNDDDNYNGKSWILSSDGKMYIHNCHPYNCNDIWSTGNVSAGVWSHVAISVNAGEVTFYINGIASGSGAPVEQYGLPWKIGRTWVNLSNGLCFNGNIDEVRIWEIARTEAEIQADMHAGNCGDQNGLVAYYTFDQGIAGGNNATETTLYNVTSNNNNGTLTGFALTGATSNWVTGVPGISNCNNCAPPSNLKVAKLTASSATLKWTLPASFVEGFYIFYKPKQTPDWTKILVKPTANNKKIEGLLPNTTYKWKISSLCTDSILNWIDGPDFTTEGVLPVTLTNLKAYKENNSIKVGWTSVTEINLSGYEIQRSSDVQGFATIGKIVANSKGTLQKDYTFNDQQPLGGNNYYRIKANDNDGKTNFSNIVLININNNKTITVVYPVPAKNIMNIETNGNASFSLLDQSGKILLTKTIDGKGSFNVAGIAAGLYYLKNNSNGAVQKVMITK